MEVEVEGERRRMRGRQDLEVSLTPGYRKCEWGSDLGLEGLAIYGNVMQGEKLQSFRANNVRRSLHLFHLALILMYPLLRTNSSTAPPRSSNPPSTNPHPPVVNPPTSAPPPPPQSSPTPSTSSPSTPSTKPSTTSSSASISPPWARSSNERRRD